MLQRAFGMMTSRTGARRQLRRQSAEGGEEETFTATGQTDMPSGDNGDAAAAALAAEEEEEEEEEEGADNDEEDEEYFGEDMEDDDEPPVHAASVFNLSTRRIVFDFNTMNIHVHC
jgi:hypothetical protein